MKKKIFGLLLFLIVLSVHASSSFTLKDKYKLNLEEEILNKFSPEYKLSYEVKRTGENEKIVELSKKITYILLGSKSYQQNDSVMDYYNRMEELVKYIYDPDIPQKDGKDDTSSDEYIDASTANLVVSNVFDQINELDVVYSSIDEVMAYRSGRFIISTVYIPNVLMKEEDPDDISKYRRVKVNLVMYYYFLENKGEYQLYNVVGKPTSSVDEYLGAIEKNSKLNELNLAPQYDDSINKLYKGNQLANVTNNDIKRIYELNKNKLVTLTSFSGDNRQYESISGNGFLINKGIIATTWDTLYRFLKTGAVLSVLINDKPYEVDGIITVNTKSNLALIKLKEQTNEYVTLSNNINVGDPVISITQRDVGYSANKGLLISNEGYNQSTIPISNIDAGGAVFNTKGEVVGMMTGELVDVPTSLQVPYDALVEAQNKFSTIDFSTIKAISFDELKEGFYVKYEDLKVEDNLSESTWKEIDELTGIKSQINLKLVRANEDNGMVTLRYKNLFGDNSDTLAITSNFRALLVEKGFVEDYVSSTKIVYKKDNKRVIIMKDFEYVVIVMVV